MLISFLNFIYRQFLLELLTDKDYLRIIEWKGYEGEFRFLEPDIVAHLWGIRKNRKEMNYNEMSRSLRYYYGGPLIKKVKNTRFTYQFICDLKELIGYNAKQLSDLVNGIPRQPRQPRP